ncbi:hypothetical protein H6P81_001801 [Aristolochia fimbriata]|uniref:DNA repair metallo-beta-lactamase domain-containing protein n=1 Tax=Aristolochia fimbriata TaxID=158543 RepID=A0AAV7FCH3_ARIFI|nr:hypothetical protein H6P81_001801 [Aristolochia fimbriata]
MPKGLPFSVDTWSPASRIKRYHFLTHAHKDHSSQIVRYAAYPIYATRLTKSLLLLQYPQLHESLFVEIEVGQEVTIDDPDGRFSVTAFDANHCPGAVMFLFEGGFGNILHTGDCRLTLECLQNLPAKYLPNKSKQSSNSLDYLFLDCTFGKYPQKIQSKHSAIRQVISCIWRHPNAPVVYLACDLLGQEEILVEVSKTFGSKIYVDRNKNEDCFRNLMLIAPHILSQDPSSRFQVFEGFPKLYERASAILSEVRANLQPEPLFIRPSAQWYACEEHLGDEERREHRFKGAEKDQFGVWHICYSMHSSREELEWALELLQPRWVVSTTPSCRAMELDYVKKNCFCSKITPDDPLWKLLDINTGNSCSLQDSPKFKVPAGDVTGHEVVDPIHLKPNKSSMKSIDLELEFCPPSKGPITLFGRARLGPQELTLIRRTEKASSSDVGPSKIETETVVLLEKHVYSCLLKESKAEKAEIVSLEKSEDCGFQKESESSVEAKVEPFTVNLSQTLLNKTEGFGAPLIEKSTVLNKTEVVAAPLIEKLKHLKETDERRTLDVSLRELYRSMNVPVPRPLPSLVEHMRMLKRAKSMSFEGRNS